MSENYSVTTELNAGPMLSGLDSIISKLQQVDSAIAKAGSKTISPKIDQSGFSGGLFKSLESDYSKAGSQAGTAFQNALQNTMGQTGGGFAGALMTGLTPAAMGIAALGVGTAALGSAAIKAAASWESLGTSVGRTTGLQGKELENLMNDLQKMRMEMGITAQAASSMTEQAGSIGVGQKKMERGDLAGYRKEITDFVQATAMLQGAWGMSAEATAQGIGKMGSVTLDVWNKQRVAQGQAQLSWKEYALKVGGSVDNLANAMGSSEEEIVTAMKNASGAVATYSPSENTYGKWTALASFLIDTGASAGEAGTQIERMAQNLDRRGGEIGKLIGVDRAALGTKLKTDFVGTIQEIGGAIAQIPMSQRPDLSSMFGLEGKALIDKVVADIENGSGKLQNAIKLGLSPSNVLEGWDKVSDDARKQFERISSAFQVALEKVGTVVLPIVSGIASGIASAMEGAINTGSNIWGGISERMTKGDEALKTTGSAWEQWKAILGIGSDAGEAGTVAGKEFVDEFGNIVELENLDFLKDKAGPAGAAAGKTASDAFNNAMNQGLADWNTSRDALIRSGAIAAQSTDTKWGGASRSLGSSYNSLGMGMAVQYIEASRDAAAKAMLMSGGQVIATLSDSMAVGIANSDKLKQAWIDSFMPAITSIPKYLDKTKGRISESISSALEDGILNIDEKNALKGIISELEAIGKGHPIEFQASNLDKVKTQIENALHGINIDVSAKSKLEDYTSKAFAYKYSMENPDIMRLMTPGQRDTWAQYGPKIGEEAGIGLRGAKDASEAYELLLSVFSQPNLASIESATYAFKTLYAYSPELQKSGSWLREIQEQYVKNVEEARKGAKPGEAWAYTADWYLGNNPWMRTKASEDLNLPADLKLKFDKFATEQVNTKGSVDALLLPSQQTAINTANTAMAVGNLAINLQSLASALGAKGYSGIGQSPYGFAQNTAFGSPAIGPTGSFYGALAKKEEFNLIDLLMPGLPRMAQGGKVLSEGLAWVGEKGTEYVIPQSDIPGLLPKRAEVEKGSMQYLTGEKFFEDYQVRITPPTSYQWAHYPRAPNIDYNGQAPTAWLSEGQPTGNDYIQNKLRQMQLDYIGKSQVVPWFARGYSAQPSWWTEAATKLSPQYAANWAMPKGGEVPQIDRTGKLNTDIQAKLTTTDAWNAIYDNSGTCIAFVEPDPSLKFTPNKNAVTGKIDKTAWNAIYDNSGTCIAFVEPDPSLKFTPSSQYTSQRTTENADLAIADLDDSIKELDDNIKSLNIAKSAFPGGAFPSNINWSSVGGGQTGKLAWKDRSGQVLSYDPRTDTCDNLGFVAPDPSLKTTDLFYLGATKDNPARKSVEDSGWGGVTAQLDESRADARTVATYQSMQNEQANQQLAKIGETTSDTAKNTAQMSKDMKSSMAGYGYDSATGRLVWGGGGMSGALNDRGVFGGSYGTMFGGWYGGGAGGLSSAFGTAPASSWMNAAAISIGGSDAIQWAEGDIVDHPTFGVFGEAGREAFVPISDRRAGLRIIPRVLSELGIPVFAAGAIVGNQSFSGSYSGAGASSYSGSASGSSRSSGNTNVTVILKNPVSNINMKQLAEYINKAVSKEIWKKRKA